MLSTLRTTSRTCRSWHVGYFYSIDIGWFSFFSVSEHIEFALRALPLAVAALVILAILIDASCSSILNAALEGIGSQISALLDRNKLQQIADLVASPSLRIKEAAITVWIVGLVSIITPYVDGPAVAPRLHLFRNCFLDFALQVLKLGDRH
jgi:hypothetical protein